MVSEKEVSIFIVDDNIPVVVSMVTFFESKGFRVISAYNAKEAISVYLETKPDIVIMGSRLHNVAVFDLAKTLNYPKVIFITSHPEMVAEAKKIPNCVGVVGKPINYHEIYTLVRKKFNVPAPKFQ
jgi:DNA-binding NtrC family response regulator